jgi:SAM-dependent methyltransferase
MTDWFENKQFWHDTGPFLFPEERWRRTAEEVDQLVNLLDITPPEAVLDLPCGPGRHSIELADRGFAVTGVDLTEEYVEMAWRHADERHVSPEFLCQDMRTFRRDAAFDALLNMFTSFGYFRDPADDRRVAENFLASLKPGGQLLMEMIGKEVLARIFQPRRFEREEGGVIFLQETEIRDDWSWVRNRWTAIRDDERFSYELEHRIYSAAELRTLLESVGFEEITCYGSLAGHPYDHQALRLIVRARRPV